MMKKTILLTAMLGAATLAHADISYEINETSKVSVGLWFDLGLQRVGTPDGSDWKVTSSGPPMNRVMFRGQKTFSPNLEAFAYLEHRFRPNTGENAPGANVSAPTEVQLYRHSWLGLRGDSWGELRVGKMLNVLQEFNGGYEPWKGGTTVANVHTGGINSGVRQNNTIYYKSPEFGGLRAHVSVSDDEGNTNNASITDPKTLWAVGGQYKAGPWSVAAAFDKGIREQETKGVYGSYNFGFATLMAQWESGDNGVGTASVTRRSVGAVIPSGKFTYMLGYLNQPDEKRNRFGAGLEYWADSQLGFYTDIGLNRGDGWTAAQRKAQFDIGFRVKF
jgi:predicted porin